MSTVEEELSGWLELRSEEVVALLMLFPTPNDELRTFLADLLHCDKTVLEHLDIPSGLDGRLALLEMLTSDASIARLVRATLEQRLIIYLGSLVGVSRHVLASPSLRSHVEKLTPVLRRLRANHSPTDVPVQEVAMACVGDRLHDLRPNGIKSNVWPVLKTLQSAASWSDDSCGPTTLLLEKVVAPGVRRELDVPGSVFDSEHHQYWLVAIAAQAIEANRLDCRDAVVGLLRRLISSTNSLARSDHLTVTPELLSKEHNDHWKYVNISRLLRFSWIAETTGLAQDLEGFRTGLRKATLASPPPRNLYNLGTAMLGVSEHLYDLRSAGGPG